MKERYPGPYAATRQRCARAYQRRTQRSKGITHRINTEDNHAISTKCETHINTATGTVTTTNALWHRDRYIYPTKK